MNCHAIHPDATYVHYDGQRAPVVCTRDKHHEPAPHRGYGPGMRIVEWVHAQTDESETPS